MASLDAAKIVEEQSGSLSHRGPDHADHWIDPDVGIALGHRRLSILDLSPAGHQPMVSESERYIVALNGEIYNHLSLRKELVQLDNQRVWRGHSDTETMLTAIDQWGVKGALKKCVGMFAFALWDRKKRALTVARDRMGEKPLFFGWQDDIFLFASELKAITLFPAFNGEIDRDVLSEYFRYGYIEAPHSIYQNIYKLLPGTFIQINAETPPGELPEPTPYWSLRQVVEGGLRNPFDGSDREAVDALEDCLSQSVAGQRIADVPLGAFLSGGIDSSTIVALMQSQSSQPVRTFTIGFNENLYNEATHARKVAKHLGTEHTELNVTAKEAMDVVPKLPLMFDEPFGDSSAVPTYLVSKLARQNVTVSLSGDGGDELFGGYSRYQQTLDLWSSLGRIPRFARRILSSACNVVSSTVHGSAIGRKSERLSRYLSAKTAWDCYQIRVTQLAKQSGLVLGTASTNGVGIENAYSYLGDEDLLGSMMYFDSVSYLPDDILTKVDRASMGVSLESRVPMLDHRVVEFAWQLPRHLKTRDGDGKWLLKQLLRRYIPDTLTERPKMGFGVPVGDWIKGPMRDWAESHLSESRLRHDGILNSKIVREQWSRHLNAGTAGGDSLWQILMFQSWLSAATTHSTSG